MGIGSAIVKLQEKKLATTHIVQDFFYQALAFVTFISKASEENICFG
jgi:hypothetical protein